MTNVSILLTLAIVICKKKTPNDMIYVLKYIQSNLWMREFIF